MIQGAFTGLRLREEDAVGPVRQRDGAIAVLGPAAAPPIAPPLLEAQASRARPLLPGATVRRRLIGLADVACATTALIAVFAAFTRQGAGPMALACAPMILVLFKVAGLYDRDELLLSHSTLDEAPRLLQVTGLLALGVAILEPALVRSGLAGLQIGALWIASFVAVATGRTLARGLAGRIQDVERCLVVGDLEQANHVRERLAESRARAQVVACVPLTSEDLVELESPAFVADLVRDLRVDRLIVVPTIADANGGADLIRTAKAVGVQVSLLPPVLDVVGSAFEFDEINGLTMLGVRRFGIPRSARVVKRAFDMVVASLALLATAPIIAAIAIAIRLDSEGPVFFRQIRVGRDGKHFSMIKFRSMHAHADTLKDDLRSLSEAGPGLFKIADDPRVTPVGRFLRRTSLDELPQIFNVLRGEMSLVGPRPLVTDEDALIVGLGRSRLDLTPGMTGPWQVLTVRLPLDEMVEIDYRYVSNWSVWLDLKILLRTAQHVARRGNL